MGALLSSLDFFGLFSDPVESQYTQALRSMEAGEKDAKTVVAWFKLSGYGGVEKDETGAVALLEQQVGDGDSEAMWLLGLCKEYGIGTEKSVEMGDELYKKSQDAGNAVGEFLSKLHACGKNKVVITRLSFI